MHIILKIKIIILITGVILAPDIFAQSINFGIPPIRNFPKKIYMAGTQNWDAAQGRDGVMYWANNEGLLRYDGTNWTCTPVTNSTILRSIAYTDSGEIFGGAQSELGYYAADKNGRLAYTSILHLLPESFRAFEDVWDTEYFQDLVFFRTNKTIFQFDGREIKIHAPTGQLNGMFSTPSGLLVQRGMNDLLRFENGQFVPFQMSGDLQSEISGIHAWTTDTLLVTTLKDGIFYLTGNQLNRWKTPHDALLSDVRIYSSTLLPNGALALGTSADGLIILNRKRNMVRHFTIKTGLQNNNILDVFSDREGNVWLGLDNGIDCIILNSPFSHIYPDGDLKSTGYAATVYGQNLLLGVSSGAYTAPWKSFYEPDSGPVFNMENSTNGQVWSLHVIGGRLLMGHHEGAFVLHSGQAEKISMESGAWTFVELNPEYMLGGTYTGLVLYQKSPGGWQYKTKIKGLEESCRIMVKDEDGSVWVSHPYRGLYHITWASPDYFHPDITFYDQRHGLPSHLNNYVFEISGKAVFGTGQGVYRYLPEMDSFVPDGEFSQLLGNTHRINYLREDASGNIWYVKEDEVGVLLVDDFGLMKEVRKKVFPELSDKLVGGFEFIYPLDKNNIIFGTEEGFMHYAVPSGSGGDSLLQVIFSHITARGTRDSVLFGGYGSPLLSSDPEESTILQSGMNNLSFSYSATEYKNPELVQYRIKLEGLNDGWSEWTQDTRQNFSNLPFGKYTFHVQARIREGRESSVISYPFRIKPPWYKSRFAMGLYGLSFLGIFIGFVWKQRQSFESEKAKMKETHLEKEARHMLEVKKSKAALTDIQNEKLEVEIKYKNQELALTTMHLVQKAEILLSVKNGLNQVLSKTTHPGVRKEVQQLLNLLNFDVKLDEDWEHFAYHFDQVHADFLKILRRQYPQLSTNDYKLCAYLRMNLSTKEIAPLMNISVRGVEGSRYRLRKKLHLSGDANLTEFLLGLTPKNPVEE